MLTLLLTTSAILGLLAYFEPCTIATHTLYSAKISQGNRHDYWLRLLGIWLSRVSLLCLLFITSVLIIEPPKWESVVPALALTIMAIVYIISRFIYLPVPHLSFYKVLPFSEQLPDCIKLGLTLPACTLPLVIVVAAMAVTLGSISDALIAAFLFSSLFSLPLAVLALKGLDENGKALLGKAANISPYITAILLFTLAVFLTLPTLDMSADELSEVLSEASWLAVVLSFVAGFVFSFNPVSFTSIPVILAYVTKAHEKKNALLMGGAFIAGLIATHIILGIAAALGGDWVQGVMGRHWGLLLGPILIVMGLIWSGLLTVNLPWFGVKVGKASGLLGAFLLGIPFSVAVCPFCTPALMVVLTSSAAIGSVSFAFFLLLAFALGRSIPIMLGAWSMGWLESLSVLSRYQGVLEKIAGLVLVVAGLYLLNEYYFII